MSKNNSRSFRFSDEVKEILENFLPGGNLNDNFEQLVLFCYQAVPERAKQLKALKDGIEAHQKRRDSLLSNEREINYMISELENMRRNLAIAARRAKALAGEEGTSCAENRREKCVFSECPYEDDRHGNCGECTILETA